MVLIEAINEDNLLKFYTVDTPGESDSGTPCDSSLKQVKTEALDPLCSEILATAGQQAMFCFLLNNFVEMGVKLF